jgi:glycosyltransferase involved in cell wall biosynthesis
MALRMKGERIALVTTYDPLKTGLIGAIVARLHGAKFVPHVNGVYTSDAQWLDEKDSIENRLKRRMYPAVMRFVLKRADGIKLLFKEQLAPFQNILGSKVVRVSPSAVATRAFKNLEEKKEVLLVGCPFKLKGVDIMIDAFKRVAPGYPDWTLKILGWYPDLRPLHAAIDGHPQIHHHPPVRGSEMPEHIGSCAILVLPSRSEAMGRVLVEAMAAEKPRIGSRVDGIPTVINDGVDGYLVEPGNVADLAEKLDRLMRDPGLRRSMGLAGKARIPAEFAEEVILADLAAFYDQVLAS